MKDLREIIPHNIITLRKQQGLTQLDLAKKVNYSDKAVSRWEKGEVLPDIETLQSISVVFNVSLSYLLEEHEENTNNSSIELKRNEAAFRILMILVVWTIATIIFVLGKLYLDVFYWKIFVWAIPGSCIVLSYLNKKTKNRIFTLIINTVCCWSMLLSLYIQFLKFNPWLIFIIGIPIQAAIIVSYYTKRKPKER